MHTVSDFWLAQAFLNSIQGCFTIHCDQFVTENWQNHTCLTQQLLILYVYTLHSTGGGRQHMCVHWCYYYYLIWSPLGFSVKVVNENVSNNTAFWSWRFWWYLWSSGCKHRFCYQVYAVFWWCLFYIVHLKVWLLPIDCIAICCFVWWPMQYLY